MNQKELIKKINTIQWEWEWGRQCSPLFNYAIIKCWTQAPKELAGQVNNIIMFNKNYYTNFFVNVNDLNKAGNRAYRITTKKGFVDFYEYEAKKACQRLIKLSRLDKTKDLLNQYKIATQVLKDGDLVEVDATKGEVRILK